MRKSTLIVGGAVVAALIVGTGGGAYAAAKITGADIVDGTVTGADIKNGSLNVGDFTDKARHALKGATGATGAKGTAGLPGVKGDKGDKGDKGANGINGINGINGTDGKDGNDGKDARYVGGQWGVMHRNVIGNGDADLAGSTVKPPMGQGALNLRVGSAADKTAFGNETDFYGMKVSDLSAIGYSVFTTGENNAIAANNMPSITFEIDPNVTGSGNYTSLVYAPDNSAANKWTTIDAKADSGKHWGLTGSFFNATNDRCGINTGRCTFDEVVAYLTANNDAAQGDAKVLTAQITKGRDFAFSGAVDALVIGDTTYDFEPLGVYATK
jgi:Collagen triple helix repeat (20 copies)